MAVAKTILDAAMYGLDDANRDRLRSVLVRLLAPVGFVDPQGDDLLVIADHYEESGHPASNWYRRWAEMGVV